MIYNSAKAWCTIDQTQLKSNSKLDLLCDIVLVYRNNGFCEATKINPPDVVTPSVPKKQQRKTLSIKDVLEKVNEHENNTTIVNKVSAQVSTLNIIPDGPRVRNTRDPIPLRRRSSSQSQRETHKNKNYSDNIDDNQLDSPKRKRKKSITVSNLREPSSTRQLAQRLLTRSQLQQSAPPGKLRTIIGTVVKEEDKKLKLENDLYEQEIRRLDALNRSKNKKKPWPKDAKLVHINGTNCSSMCMSDPNSKYHSDNISELQDATPDKTENSREKTDPRVSRQMGMTENRIACEQTQTEPDNEELKDATNTQDTTRPCTNEMEIETTPEIELRVATTTDKSTDETLSNIERLTELQVTTANQKANEATKDTPNALNIEVGTSTRNVDLEDQGTSSECSNSEIMLSSVNSKPYDIRRTSTRISVQDLPQLESNATSDLDLPNFDQEFITLSEVPATETTTLTDDLPLLEHHDEMNDFESLMNLADDMDNSELMPIDGPPQPDLVRDINRECGINSDLELAMDNALFIDSQLLQSTSNNKRCRQQYNKKQTTHVTYTSTPGSPPGRLAVRTHGIRKMGPEEQQDKQFHCTDCNFKGYSRASVSDHFSKTHGVVHCRTCSKQCPNPHALKRHEYIHADDKQHVCKTCNESFFFESELKNHRVKHRTGSSFFCMHTGCG